ncbi:hypothetical protein [Microcystis phage Mae-JY24]
MAKRGIDEHPKVIDFAEALGIPVCYAIGPLELFWHWVAKYRPNGNLTGVKPSAIAHAIRFPGNGQDLMDALVSSGLVDCLEDGRVLVHDWSEHADNSVHQLLKKKGELFADGNKPFTRNRVRQEGAEQTVHEPFTNRSRLPEPEPEPEPVNTLSLSARETETAEVVAEPPAEWGETPEETAELDRLDRHLTHCGKPISTPQREMYRAKARGRPPGWLTRAVDLTIEKGGRSLLDPDEPRESPPRAKQGRPERQTTAERAAVAGEVLEMVQRGGK